MQYLPSWFLKDKYYLHIEDFINALFYDVLYKPILRLLDLNENELRNSFDPLFDAITRGLVAYRDGAFTGKFNAQISKQLTKLGAKYDVRNGTWVLALNNMEPNTKMMLANAQFKYDDTRHKIMQHLDGIDLDQLVKPTPLELQYNHTINLMDTDFKHAVEAISVVPEITKKMQSIIAKQWGKNLNLYIKGWLDENILQLREQVTTNTLAGGRSTNMLNLIQENYGVSKNKARFLARQETSMLLSEMREQRYQDVGSETYRWRGVDDERERHDHKDLNNKIFSWKSPPVSNRKTGARNHPGKDYGCRCWAEGIIN